MNDAGTSFPSLVHLQFRRAKALCKRNVPISQQPTVNTDNLKSCAQVAVSVRQLGVRRTPCGLKPGESKPFRLIARFTENEREYVVRQAKNACLTVSEYIRASVLGPSYASSIDPVKNQQLIDANRELSRQGNNLNQIARYLNAELVSPSDTDSMLAIIARSLLAAHQAVRQALAEGRDSEI